MTSAEEVMRTHLEKLSNTFRDSFEKGDVVELRSTFLALTTDIIASYALGQSTGFQDDQHKSEQWFETSNAIAAVTPLVKQFPWTSSFFDHLPVSAVHFFLPEFARYLQVHQVRYPIARCMYWEGT